MPKTSALNSDALNPTLIALKPRQVLLAKPPTMPSAATADRDGSETPVLSADQKTRLLLAVARYLERNGFSKTLRKLLSEAKVEEGNIRDAAVDLEEMYCNYLKESNHAVSNSSIQKERDNQLCISGRDRDGTGDVVKKKKKSGDDHDSKGTINHSNTVDRTSIPNNSDEVTTTDIMPISNIHSKEKRKMNKVFDSGCQKEEDSSVKTSLDNKLSGSQFDKDDKEVMDKKKRKKDKSVSESLVQKQPEKSFHGKIEEKSKDQAFSEGNIVIGSDEENKSKDKKKKKKKNKLTSDSDNGNAEECRTENFQAECARKSKDGYDPQSEECKTGKENKLLKKKKKDKSVSESMVQQQPEKSFHGEIEEKSTHLASLDGNIVNGSKEENKSKGKKKKRSKLTSDTGDDNAEECKRENLQAECARKSKDVDDLQSKEGKLDKENKLGKKRKRMAPEEKESHTVDGTTAEKSKRLKAADLEKGNGDKQLTEVNVSQASYEHSGKETSVLNGQVGPKSPQKTPKKQLTGHENGNVEKDNEGPGSQKSLKKQRDTSAEPKTVTAFQRVKVDEVVFPDQRLQDNSYWAKDGAESGYGAKAQEVLGQVRGRDFRHEKTKKKRGSYRGGQIDLQSHSIKFNYSDED